MVSVRMTMDSKDPKFGAELTPWLRFDDFNLKYGGSAWVCPQFGQSMVAYPWASLSGVSCGKKRAYPVFIRQGSMAMLQEYVDFM